MDARAGLDYLRLEGVADAQIVLFGESLGSGVAVQMAAERPVGALVLDSPGTSITAIAQYHYRFVPVRWLIRDRFDSLSKIGDVRAPVLVMHGERDTIIPVAFGRELFDAAHEPKEWRPFPNAGHVELHAFGAAEVVLAFIGRHLPDWRL